MYEMNGIVTGLLKLAIPVAVLLLAVEYAIARRDLKDSESDSESNEKENRHCQSVLPKGQPLVGGSNLT